MSYSVGIDLGITFVAAARATAATVDAVSLSDRSVLAPAVVYLQGDGTLATGEAASRRAMSSPDRIGREFTRLLGDPTPLMLGGQPYPVTELLSVLLRDVVQKITEVEGEPPDRIMLTYPASWGPFRRALFEEAAQQAGLNNPAMVTEPEAAVANYTATRALNDGETVAVYDLGGSAFDATVLRKQPGGVQIIGKPERIERLGGADFDEVILSHVNDIAGGALTDLDVRRPQTFVALAGVRQACTVAKEALSVDTETAFPVFLPSRSFDINLTRSDFENMARAPIESTIRTLSRALQSAKVAPADLSAVLLVGGSSRIPLVARMVSAELGCPTVVDTDPQHVVALGAATLASHAAYPRVGRPHNNRAQNNGAQNNGAQNNGAQSNRAQSNGAPHESRRRDSRADTASVPTATVNTVLDTRSPQLSPEHDVALPIPAQRPADAVPAEAIPAQRTPSNGATAATARHVRPIEPRPPPPAAPDRARRPRVLLAAGAAAALAAVIALAVYGGRSATQASAPPHPPKPAPTAVAIVAPKVMVPTFAATIQVGTTPNFVAVSPDGEHAYVANGDAQVLTVVDTATNRVTGIIPIAAGSPQFLTFAPDGRTLYITIFNDQHTEHSIDVLDTVSHTEMATIPQPASPFDPAVTSDGKLLYVPNHDVAAVSVISTETNRVVGQIKVAPNPHSIAFSRDGSRAYTADHESHLVSVINTATDEVVATIPVGSGAHSIAVNPNRPLVANVNYESNSVSVIDTNTLRVVATIPVGQQPEDIAWSPDGRFAYVVNSGSNTVSVIDAATNQVTATIPTGAGPSSIAVLPNGHQAYVSNVDSGTLTVLELPH